MNPRGSFFPLGPPNFRKVGTIHMKGDHVLWKLQELKLEGCILGLLSNRIRSSEFAIKNVTWCFSLTYSITGSIIKIQELKLHKLFDTPAKYRIKICAWSNSGREIESGWLDEKECVLNLSTVNLLIRDNSTLTFTCEINEASTLVDNQRGTEESSNGSISVDGKNGKQTPIPKGAAKLIAELEEVLLSEKDSDVVLNVEGKEFKAHRLILGMRSPVFSAMFEHDMTEKKTGVVNIEDCDKSTFSDFLHFMYTGSIDKLSSVNVRHLYRAADKYQLPELKEECLEYMMKNVSVRHFCEFLDISLQYNEVELTNRCTQFFLENASNIVETVEWLTFLGKNMMAANELFVKLAKHKSRK